MIEYILLSYVFMLAATLFDSEVNIKMFLLAPVTFPAIAVVYFFSLLFWCWK